MKFVAKIAILGLSFGLNTLTQAAPLSSTIPLNNGAILPGKTFTITTSGLYPNVKYDVVCHLMNNSSNTTETKSHFALYRSKFSTAYVDDKEIYAGSGEVNSFNPKGSILKIHGVNRETNDITLMNLDFTEPYIVSDCKAILIVK
jgi:hypothetical protein